MKQLPKALMGARAAVADRAGALDVASPVESMRETLSKDAYTANEIAYEKERAAKAAFDAMVRWSAFNAMGPAKPQ